MGAKKMRLNGRGTGFSRDQATSNLASSTSLVDLIDSKLQNSTDKPLTKNEVFYKPPKIHDANGDLKKQWFVYYSYKDPKTGKFTRFKLFRDINQFNRKQERYERAKAIAKAMEELLQEGYSPFTEFKPELNNFSISNCIDIFLRSVKSGLKPKSYKKYETQLLIFKEWLVLNNLGDVFIGEIKKSHVFRFLQDTSSERGHSGKTYNAYKNNISRMFSFFINNHDDLILKNPAMAIESRPVVTKGNQAYSDIEFHRVRELILETDPYLWAVCQFVYYTALRNEQELLKIRIRDIDLKNRIITVPGSIAKTNTKGIIPIYPEFEAVLEHMKLERYDPDWYVFGRGDKPGPVRVGEDNFARRFRVIKRELGLGDESGIYAFKHTRACHMVDDGASLFEIQTLFRHQDLSATMKYLRSIGRVVKSKELTKSRVV